MTKCNGLPSERGPGAEAAAESNLHALPIETLLPLVRRRVHHAARAANGSATAFSRVFLRAVLRGRLEFSIPS